MSTYRDLALDSSTRTTVFLEPVLLPSALRTGVWRAVGGVLIAMLVMRHFEVAVFAVGALSLVLMELWQRRASARITLDREEDRLEIHRPYSLSRKPIVLRLSSVDEVVCERTRLFARVYLSTRLRGEIAVWSGLLAFAGETPLRVRAAIVEPLEEAKTARSGSFTE